MNRYQRHIDLKGFGVKAQQKLAESRVLIVGAGGLGVPAALYLNAMGTGTLGLIDGDRVMLTNLHRQVIYTENDVGEFKLDCLEKHLRKQNGDTRIVLYKEFLVWDNARAIIEDYDLVIDATDNFKTRYIINDACLLAGKPFVYAGLYAFEGQLSVFNYKGGPSYRCLFPVEPGADEIPDCNVNGVLGVLPGIIGNLQALEAVKVLCDLEGVLSGKLFLFDGLTMQTRVINISRNEANFDPEKLKELQAAPMKQGQLTASEFMQKFQTNKEMQIVDVRTEKEFNSFHLPGSRNIPLDELTNSLHEKNLAGEVYLICETGVRSRKAAAILREKKGLIIFEIKGGISQCKLYGISA